MFRYKISDDKFKEAVANSYSMANLLANLGMVGSGGNYKSTNVRMVYFGINFGLPVPEQYGRKINVTNIPLEEILVENSRYTGINKLKKRIIKAGIFVHKCYGCNRRTWKGQKIPIELDHINGNNTDHRLSNLRILCPNCHALTDTYCGRNIGKTKKQNNKQDNQ